MHSYIDLTNKYPIVFPHCTHRYSFPPEQGQTVNAGAMWGWVPTPTLQLSSLLWPAIHTHMLQLALLLPFGAVPGPNTATASSTLRDWSIMYFVSLLAVVQTCPWLTRLNCIRSKLWRQGHSLLRNEGRWFLKYLLVFSTPTLPVCCYNRNTLTG